MVGGTFNLLRAAEEAGAEVAVVEVPLLFENDLADRFDWTVTVDAPRAQRLDRVREERDLPEHHFASMETAQWSGERKREAADLVIVNDGDREELEREARRVWERVRGGAPGEGG
ncbi:MAG: dephospho-CoA kinase [Gemmatimonadota bacterium]